MNLFPWRVTLRRSAPCARPPFAARSRKTHRAQGALLRALLIVLVLAFAASATAQAIDPLPFKDHAQELRFQHHAGIAFEVAGCGDGLAAAADAGTDENARGR